MTQEYEVEDLFDLSFVPKDTPLYIILTGGSGNIKAEGELNYSIEILSIVRTYLETGVIDIVGLFEDESDDNKGSNEDESDDRPIDIDELVDAFRYLLSIHKPVNFPAQYWFATLTENWILDQWKEGNTPTDNKWLIDVTDWACKMYGYSLFVLKNPDYVIAGKYVLSLINPRNHCLTIDTFYVGEREKREKS